MSLRTRLFGVGGQRMEAGARPHPDPSLTSPGPFYQKGSILPSRGEGTQERVRALDRGSDLMHGTAHWTPPPFVGKVPPGEGGQGVDRGVGGEGVHEATFAEQIVAEDRGWRSLISGGMRELTWAQIIEN